jgi:hypothetical protein
MLPDGLVIEDRAVCRTGAAGPYECPDCGAKLQVIRLEAATSRARASNLPKLQGCPPRSRRQRFADLQARRTAGYRRWRVSAVARFSIAYRRPAFFVEPLNRSFIRICYEPRRGWGLADGRFRSGRADHPGHDDPARAGADLPAVTSTENIRGEESPAAPAPPTGRLSRPDAPRCRSPARLHASEVGFAGGIKLSISWPCSYRRTASANSGQRPASTSRLNFSIASSARLATTCTGSPTGTARLSSTRNFTNCA